MKTRSLLLRLVALGTVAMLPLANAQDAKKGRGPGGSGGRGMMSAEQRIERLEEAVGKLTDDQKAKIKDIYAKTSEKMQGLSDDERREKGMELMRESGRAVRAVLTEEQQKKYDEMMAQMGQGRGGPGGGGGRKKGGN
jgi:Spy/CpxP family protein refolding chaperone